MYSRACEGLRLLHHRQAPSSVPELKWTVVPARETALLALFLLAGCDSTATPMEASAPDIPRIAPTATLSPTPTPMPSPIPTPTPKPVPTQRQWNNRFSSKRQYSSNLHNNQHQQREWTGTHGDMISTRELHHGTTVCILQLLQLHRLILEWQGTRWGVQWCHIFEVWRHIR